MIVKQTKGPFAEHLRTILAMLEPYDYETQTRLLRNVQMILEVDRDIPGTAARVIKNSAVLAPMSQDGSQSAHKN